MRFRTSLLALAALPAFFLAALPATAQSGYVYWTNYATDTIGRANLDGTGANQSFITGASSPMGVAIDGQYIYWANRATSTIGRSNLDGTGVNQSFIPDASVNVPVGVGVSGQHVYWANSGSGRIGRANLNGTGANSGFINPVSGVYGLVVSGPYLYWTRSSWGTIGRANLDGTGVNQSLITGANKPTSVVVSDKYVYWVNSGTSPATIGRANLDGTGANQSFITGTISPVSVVVDAQYIYWTNYSTNSIGRANLDGTGVNPNFITGANQPLFLTVTNASTLPVELVSFTAAASGRTARLAWTTASETNNAGFVVERQTTTRGAWTDVSPLLAGRGTTTERSDYTFAVEGLTAGRHTFRLRQTDTDGAVHHSAPVTVEIGVADGLVLTALGRRGVRVETDGDAEVSVYDVLGRRVRAERVAAGTTVLGFEGWSAGVYVVHAEGPGGREATLRLVVR